MAPSNEDVVSEARVNCCKRCKQQTQNGLKCIVCGVITHQSCAKQLKGVKFISEGHINCCVSDSSTANVDKHKYPALVDAKSVEIKYLKELLKQKDLIIETQVTAISNQADLIDSLKDQINMLKNKVKAVTFPPKSTSIPPVTQEDPVATVQDASGAAGNLFEFDGTRVHAAAVEGGQSVAYQQRPGTSRQAMLEIAAAGKVQPVSTGLLKQGRQDEQGFKLVEHRKRGQQKQRLNKPVIGELPEDGGCHLKAAMTYNYWHVYKLDPNTTAGDLKDYLKREFPEVLVENLKSRNPEEYASFKIAVSERNRDSIRKPSLWPAGVRINRFFLPRNAAAKNQPV